MAVEKNIPEIPFYNRDNKSFEFQIANNREILLNVLPNQPDLFRPHRIQFYALLLILKGKGNHFLDFKKYKYREGSVIFISKEQVSAFEHNDNRDAFFLLFTENFLERGSQASNLLQELSLYNYHLYDPILNLNEKELSVFKNLVLKIEEEYLAPDDVLTEEIIQASLKILLCLAERIRKKRQKKLKISKYQAEFLDFQKLLNLHLFSSRQVQFYAKQMGMSTKKLNRITQEVIRKPAKSYINDMLILEIKRLLMNTSLSIKEIGFKIGFEDPTNFVKYFKKYTDRTPIEFRKAY